MSGGQRLHQGVLAEDHSGCNLEERVKPLVARRLEFDRSEAAAIRHAQAFLIIVFASVVDEDELPVPPETSRGGLLEIANKNSGYTVIRRPLEREH